MFGGNLLKKKPTLQVKFILAANLLIVPIIIAAALLVEFRQRNTIIEEVKKRAITLAEGLGAASAIHLLTYNYIALEQLAAQVSRQADVLYAITLDKEGLIASHSEDKSTEGQRLEDAVSLKAASTKQILVEKYSSPRYGKVYDVAVPVFIEGSPEKWGTIRVGVSLERMYREIAQTRWRISLFGVLALILGSVGSVLVARRVTGPIRELMKGVEAVGRGDLSQQIPVRSRDEIGELAEAFNTMTQQLSRMRELEEQLRRSERLAALGTMAAGIAHDIRNPLTSISIFTQLITHHFMDPEVRAKFERIVPRELDRVQRILEDMLELARPTTLSLETIDMNEALLQTLELFELPARDGEITTVTQLATDLPRIRGDRKKLYRCFGNIIQNAIQSMSPGGELRIISALSYRPAIPFSPSDPTPSAMVPFVKVMIVDTGQGIFPEVLARIFDPFFTTKEKGVGLGMAIVHRIVEDHRGTIEVSSVVGSGTTFTVLLPGPVGPKTSEPV